MRLKCLSVSVAAQKREPSIWCIYVYMLSILILLFVLFNSFSLPVFCLVCLCSLSHSSTDWLSALDHLFNFDSTGLLCNNPFQLQLPPGGGGDYDLQCWQ